MGRIILIIITVGFILGLGAVSIDYFKNENYGSSQGVKTFCKNEVEKFVMDEYGWNPELRFKHVVHKGDGLWRVSGLLKVDDGHGHIETGTFKTYVQFKGIKEKSWGEYEDLELVYNDKVDTFLVMVKIKNFENLVQYKGDN